MIDDRLRVPAAWWATFQDPPSYVAEVIQGGLVLSPSPSRVHQRAVANLTRILGDAAPAGFEVLAGLEWRIDDGGMIVQAARPDLMVAQVTDDPVVAAPLLVVEVLAATDDYDQMEDRVQGYADNGLRYYLEVAVGTPTAGLFEVEAGTFGQVAYVVGDSLFETEVPFPFSFNPLDLIR